MARSACRLMPVLSLSVLFEVSGSGVVLDTVAVLTIGPLTVEAMRTVTVTAVMVLAGSGVGWVQVRSCPVAEQVQPGPVAETKVRPVGRVSVMAALAASEGPWLATVNRYGALLPATKVPTCCFWICRSALICGVAVSLAGFGSGVVVCEDVSPA